MNPEEMLWVQVNFEEADQMRLHFLLFKVQPCFVENQTQRVPVLRWMVELHCHNQLWLSHYLHLQAAHSMCFVVATQLRISMLLYSSMHKRECLLQMELLRS